MDRIIIQGARTHNLKNLTLTIPRDKLVIITGPSGSGKSSLAFDTLYAEGQRRYVESLSAYARQFLSQMEKPDVDSIEGLSPAISIEQKSTSHNPRSTVGTTTEIYDYLRLLFARIGIPKCPNHNIDLSAQSVSNMVDEVLKIPADTKLMLLAPVVRDRKGEYIDLFKELAAKGFVRARVDGKIIELDNPPKLSLHHKHSIEVIIDRFKVRDDIKTRLAESFDTALKLSDGLAVISFLDSRLRGNDEQGDKDVIPADKDVIPAQAGNVSSAAIQDLLFSATFSCPHCGYSISELEPRLFSFNNPIGACQTCDGLGITQYFDPEKIIYDETVSLRRGAIDGWDDNNYYSMQLLTALGKHYGFDVDTKFNKLTKKQQKIILYGSGDEDIEFVYSNQHGRTVHKKHPFEGVIPNMERRYRETGSNYVREELTKFIINKVCADCSGSRLNLQARNIFIDNMNLPTFANLSIADSQKFIKSLKLTGSREKIASKILQEIISRTQFLMDVGLEYLSLSRSADTLSGGEAQRIRLASQIGSQLVGVMYILDEPTIGLHPRDNARLLKTLHHLRDIGNTVIVVEHDEETMRDADQIIDIGPGSGVHGGEIIAQGTPQEIMDNDKSITGLYLSGKKKISIPKKRHQKDDEKLLKIISATGNNLKNVTAEFPVGLFTCVTGVSGSGKSTLINDTLYPAVAKVLNKNERLEEAPYKKIEGIDYFDKIISITQSPIGRTPRSNPATYTGLFTPIRELFAKTVEARTRGYNVGRFSFNVHGGRCETCQGDGLIKIEMHFLPDMYVMCDTCEGKRYNRETLEVLYKGKNIHQVLEMTVEDAREFFDAIPNLKRKLQTLIDVGLSYITLGQSAITLSGGEAQRIKLAKELSKRDTGRTLYLLDEPTTGLHFQDIELLLKVLLRLRDAGNTIIVIEHNLDVIKTADYIIDLGPQGGDKGGVIIATGSPEVIAQDPQSVTGKFLTL